jgi:allantoinase
MRVVLPDGVKPAAIHIENGHILRLARPEPAEGQDRSGPVVVDVGDLVVSPGLVDTHVHVNEPGRTEWEGFDTATRAAAAGGITTIVDMPLNSIPATTSVTALVMKQEAARGRVHVDAAFWGGVVPGHAIVLDALVRAGVRGFKCFLVPSGVDQFRHVGERELREAMPILAHHGVPLLVHAEHPAYVTHPTADTYPAWLASRPPSAEVEAIRMVSRLAREFDVRVHIVHVASAEAADAVAAAKADGVRMTAETCPHYLTFAAEEIPDGATEFKCAPPIREARHREALWRALENGTLDLVATDHSPSPPSMKSGGFSKAWGGIASLELSLATLNFQLSSLSVESSALRLATWASEAPAALAGLARKGRIAEGYDADFVIWDPDAEWTVDAARLQQRHKLTPYAGRTLRGRVAATYVRGIEVWRDGQLMHANTGQLL